MGESRWAKSLDEGQRIGTIAAEAYTHSLIENNLLYMAI